MNGGDLESGGVVPLPEDYVTKAIQFIVNAHAATVNLRLYPPTSSMVTETFGKATEWLEQLLEERQTFAVSTLENVVLINDTRLDETEQQKPPVRSFVSWMTERGLTSIEFKAGVTAEEVKALFEVLGELVEKPELRANLTEELSGRGVRNAFVNQRVYVAVSQGEEGELAEGALRKTTPLDALKDELLIRYLMGKVDLSGVKDRELIGVLADPGKVGGLMSRFLEEEGAGEGVLVRSRKADEALSRLSEMIDAVGDEELRRTLSGQVAAIVSEMNPREMTSVLSGQGPETIDIAHVRKNVITMLRDQQLLDIVDSLIEEYTELRMQAEELDSAWTRNRLKRLNDLLLEVRTGEKGDSLAEVIDRKLDDAGIVEERDDATGHRVLSACEILGGPLEEEDVPDLGEDIDRTVPNQIRKLYAMHENDLAAGLLSKLSESLASESGKVRRFASTLIRETIEPMEPGDALLASAVIVSPLMGAVSGELDYRAFAEQTGALAVIAELYLKENRTDEASDILERISMQACIEGGKGVELVRHARQVTERLKGPESLADPVALMSEEDREKRLRAIRALASLGPEALSPLVGLIKDRGQAELRERAVEALRESGPTGAEALVAELDRENPWYVHRNVLVMLGEFGRVETVKKVSEMAANPDERIRREAVWALARIGSPESLPVVLEACNDASPAVRRIATRALGAFGDRSVSGFLLDVVHGKGPRGKDEDQGVVEAACLALGDLKDSSFVPYLTEVASRGGLLRKGSPDEVRAAACLALGAIGDEAALPVLKKASKDQSALVRSSAERALARLTRG